MLALPPPGDTGARGQGPGAPPALRAFPGDGHHTRADVRMFDKALKGRWPISEAVRAEVVANLARIATDRSFTDPRAVVAASAALLGADRLNLDDEARHVKEPPVLTAPDGSTRADFSRMSDEELDRWLERSGTRG